MVDELSAQDQFGREFIPNDRLQRATISITSNSAGVFWSPSNREFAKFVYVGSRSEAEVRSHMHLARDGGLAIKEQFEKIYQKCGAVRRLTLALVRSLGQSSTPHRGPHTPDRRKAGFTLIELLVVIVIIGLLAALVGPRLFGRVGKGRQAAAQAQIELFGAALDNYRLDVGSYPMTDKGLKALIENPGGIEHWDGPYLKKSEIPLDPWGHPYVYKSPGEHGEYDIVSYGLDGVGGGEGENQDVVSWRSIKRAGERIE